MSDLPPPIPAATLIMMRPAAVGAPEMLVMERTQSMAFAAGALVFPGGRIDDEDERLAALIGDGIEHAAARIAAIRETIEETGLAPAVSGPLSPEILGEVRSGLESGVPFGQLLDRHGLRLDLAQLTPFARWCPTFKEARRFDTMFFVTEAPSARVEASAAEAEAVRLFWASADRVLAEVEAGDARVIFPTRRNLERLARFGSLSDARDDAVRHPVRKIVPWIEERDGERWLCIPEGVGYPVTAERLENARRT